MRIARVEGDALTAERVGGVEHGRAANEVDCLYVLADDDAADGARAPRTRLPARWTCASRSTRADARRSRARRARAAPSRADDLPALRAIAATSHGDSRFYADRRFPRRALRRAVRDVDREKLPRAGPTPCFVAEHDGRPAGYITCHLRRERARRRSASSRVADGGARARARRARSSSGARLVRASAGCARDGVVTQGRNVAAQRLYAARAASARSVVGFWYHRWLDGEAQRR